MRSYRGWPGARPLDASAGLRQGSVPVEEDVIPTLGIVVLKEMIARGEDHVAQVHRPACPARVHQHVPWLLHQDHAVVDHGFLLTRFDEMDCDPRQGFP